MIAKETRKHEEMTPGSVSAEQSRTRARGVCEEIGFGRRACRNGGCIVVQQGQQADHPFSCCMKRAALHNTACTPNQPTRFFRYTHSQLRIHHPSLVLLLSQIRHSHGPPKRVRLRMYIYVSVNIKSEKRRCSFFLFLR